MGCHFLLQCMKTKNESEVAKSLNPMDCSLPGSSIPGIFQARVLEWVAMSFSIPSLNLQQRKVLSVGPAVFVSRRRGLRLQVEWDRGLQALGASLPRAGGAQGGGGGWTLAEAGGFWKQTLTLTEGTTAAGGRGGLTTLVPP